MMRRKNKSSAADNAIHRSVAPMMAPGNAQISAGSVNFYDSRRNVAARAWFSLGRVAPSSSWLLALILYAQSAFFLTSVLQAHTVDGVLESRCRSVREQAGTFASAGGSNESSAIAMPASQKSQVLAAANVAPGDPGASVVSSMSANNDQLPLLREFPSPEFKTAFGLLKSGISHLTWSPSGEALAGYINYGQAISIWYANGGESRTFPRYNSYSLDSYILAFLPGGRQLVTSPAAASNKPSDKEDIRDVAFSILDERSGAVIKNLPGPHPLAETSRLNVAVNFAISPDASVATVVFRKPAEARVLVYSTANWERIAALDVGDTLREATALAFSPDGKLFAAAAGPQGRILLFDTNTWTLVRTIEAFPEKAPPMQFVTISSIEFSPDSARLAVGSFSGGQWEKENSGNEHKTQFPADPLRVLNVSDGSQVASLSGFPGGFLHDRRFAWMPDNRTLILIDAVGDLRVWNIEKPTPLVLTNIRQADSLLVSPSKDLIAVSAPNGIKLFKLDMVQR
jgi:WD40 repeat protein